MNKKTLENYLKTSLYATLNQEHSHLKREKTYPYEGKGRLIYGPSAKGVCDPTWVILECDREIVEYYTWFLRKKGVKLEFPMWGSHVSVIRGEIKNLEDYEQWGEQAEEVISFQYGDLVTNGTHWWLEAQSKELEHIRLNLQLPSRPSSGFHLTIGKIC